MPHRRSRNLLSFLKKQATFWPIVGVMGLRQVGKSTLFRELLKLSPYVSFDDDDSRRDAEASPKAFLAKHGTPLVIDETQKVPELFDALKSSVDRRRVPGSYYLTGSSAFSAQKDVRESLTGRIGLCELFPMTLAEAESKLLQVDRMKPVHHQPPRFGIEMFSTRLRLGGVPVPAFSRDASIRTQYWKNWVSTSLGRDLNRVYGKGYDPDFAERLLHDLVKQHELGVLPTVAEFKYDSRKTKKYLDAFRAIFMVRRIQCHETGTGRDIYLLTDSGMAHALMRNANSEEASLSLIRIYLLNEILANTHYAGLTPRFTYFKSRKGTPVDLVWDDTPIKVVTSLKQLRWEERAVVGAMKVLKSKTGLLVGPTDVVTTPKRGNIGLVPWSYWS